MKDFQNNIELLDYIDKTYEANDGKYPKNQILVGLLEKGVSIKGYNVQDICAQNPDYETKLIEAVNKPANEINFDELNDALLFGDEDAEGDKEEDKENKKTKNNANNYEILSSVIDEYETLCFKKAKLIQDNQGGKGLNKSGDKYKKYIEQLADYDEKLSEIENGQEMKELMQSIKDDGLGDKRYQSLGKQQSILSDIVNKVGTQGITSENPHYLGANPYSKVGTHIPELNDLVNEYLSQGEDGGIKDTKTEDKKTSSETKSNNKNNISVNGPFKPMNPTSEKVTDEMAFGSGVKGAGGNQYLEERNKSLALHLKMRGIETPEEIDAYLSKYPSWKNAKQERKDNTLGILTDKISNMQNTFNVSKKDDLSKDEVNETIDEAKKVDGGKGEAREVKDKKRLNGNKGTARDVKDKKRLGDDWQPDNDSSINGTEDEDIMYTYEDGPIKLSDAKYKGDKYGYIDEGDEEPMKNKGGKDAIVEHEEQNPGNNDYLNLDLEVKNLEDDKARIKYLEKKGYKVNKNGFYEKDGVKTKVYKDGRYNPKTEEFAKGGIGTAIRDIKTNPQDDVDILLQEQGYKGPKNASGHFIPMNEDTLNGAGDKEEIKETKKSNSSPLRKSKKETKKEDKKENKKVSMKDIVKVVKSSPTIKNLLKNSKK